MKIKTLKPIEREFLELVTYRGISTEDAYADVMGLEVTDENRMDFKRKGQNILRRPHVRERYDAIMEEIRDTQVKKAVWSKELAEQTLIRLIRKVEEELYENNANATMSRVNGIILPVKELNAMNGFNETNINIAGSVGIKFEGENELE